MNAANMLRYARRRAGLSQRELARRSGVPQPTIARIESGKTSPRVETLRKLLRECSFDLEARPRLGRGVDRTLIARQLRETPRQRLEDAAHSAETVEDLRASIRR